MTPGCALAKRSVGQGARTASLMSGVTTLVIAAVIAAVMTAVLPAAVAAQGVARVPAWQGLIERHVERQNASAPFRTVVEVAADEPGPPPCTARLRVVEVARSRWLGPLSIVLVCDQPAWRASVMVRVRGLAQVVQTSRALPAGARLTADDLRLVELDLATEPAGLATELDQVVGREISRPLRENTSVGLNALRPATVIKTGDWVTVRVFGRSFQASAEGLAQQAGAVGDTIRIKLADGKQISASVTGAGQVDVKL
jgi:flagella basal body P-ring formation protein FlgA